MAPLMTMHGVRLPHDGAVMAWAGLVMVRHAWPFQRSVPVGPPDAMQKVGEEQETLVRVPPGGFFRTRQLVPFHNWASAWRLRCWRRSMPTRPAPSRFSARRFSRDRISRGGAWLCGASWNPG